MIIRPSNTSKGMLADGIWRGSTVSPRMLTRGKVVRGRNARGDAPLRRILDQALQMDDIVALKPSVHVLVGQGLLSSHWKWMDLCAYILSGDRQGDADLHVLMG